MSHSNHHHDDGASPAERTIFDARYRHTRKQSEDLSEAHVHVSTPLLGDHTSARGSDLRPDEPSIFGAWCAVCRSVQSVRWLLLAIILTAFVLTAVYSKMISPRIIEPQNIPRISPKVLPSASASASSSRETNAPSDDGMTSLFPAAIPTVLTPIPVPTISPAPSPSHSGSPTSHLPASSNPSSPTSSSPSSSSTSSYPLLRNVSLIWDFGACGCTGWATETINFLLGIYEHIPRLGIVAGDGCFCPGLPASTLSLLQSMQRQPMHTWDVDFFISHKPPSRYPVFPYNGLVQINKRPKYVIGRSMTEVHRIPNEWAERTNNMVDEVWVPSQHSYEAFVSSGTQASRLHIIPESLDYHLYNPDTVQPYSLPRRRRYNFLSVFKWEERKDWQTLIRAFFEEFMLKKPPSSSSSSSPFSSSSPSPPSKYTRLFADQPLASSPSPSSSTPPSVSSADNDDGESNHKEQRADSENGREKTRQQTEQEKEGEAEVEEEDDVALYIHTYLYGDWDARNPQKIQQIIRNYINSLPFPASVRPLLPFDRVHVMCEEMQAECMPSLYKSADAFVLPTHGEGWGLPLMEAMVMGLPTISTNWSGQLEFMNEDNSYLIPVESMVPARGRDFEEGSMWAQASVAELRKIMRRLYEHPEEGRATGQKARASIIEKFNIERVGEQVLQRLSDILVQRNNSDQRPRRQEN